MSRVLPYTIAAISLGAGVVFLFTGDYKQAWYWFSGFSITMSVTV